MNSLTPEVIAELKRQLLIIQLKDSLAKPFCMICGQQRHEGGHPGMPPGPPALPTHCPFCGVDRGRNQMCCEGQEIVLSAANAKRELERLVVENAAGLIDNSEKVDRIEPILAAAEIWRHWWLKTHGRSFTAGDSQMEELVELRDSAEVALEHEVAALTRAKS